MGDVVIHVPLIAYPNLYSGAYPDPRRDDKLRSQYFRQGELVWVRLASPIPDRTSVDVKDRMEIDHWPAIILDCVCKTASTLLEPLSPSLPAKLDSFQSRIYHVSLLATKDSLKVKGQRILPWLAYDAKPMKRSDITCDAGIGQVLDGREAELRDLVNVSVAATAFSLATQIAAQISSSFCLSDRYSLAAKDIMPGPTFSADDQYHCDQNNYDYFQSIFYGAERIRVGELARLLMDRQIVDSATHSETIIAEQSTSRALFIQVSGFYRETASDHGKAKMSGILYALRPFKKTTSTTTVPSAPFSHSNPMPHSSTANIIESSNLVKPYYLPTPPIGFDFHRITPIGSELHVDLEFIAGRYYPLPPHLNLRTAVKHLTAVCAADIVDQVGDDEHVPTKREEMDIVKEDEREKILADKRAFALAGLLPAMYLHAFVASWKKDRAEAIITSHEEAREDMRLDLML